MMMDAAGRPIGSFQLDREQTGLGPSCRLYRTSDGWICIVCSTDEQFCHLCEALDCGGLAVDPRFAGADARATHAAQLTEALSAQFALRTAEECFRVLDGKGIPCEMPRPTSYRDAFFLEEEHLRSGRVVEYVHPEHGRVREFGQLIRLSETPGRIFGPAPTLGQHTREVLADLSYSAEQIDELKARHIVNWSEPSE
jgi:crotonobetainyl-CoA:carnitine CoA-transferase CaiB-like acyl-CoA transferase